MLYIYIFINIIFCYCANRFLYQNFWNPVSIYVAVWISNVLIHESGLIYFYPLTLKTWLILIAGESMYVLGCILGWTVAKKLKYHKVQQEDVQLERFLKIIIIAISLVVTVVDVINIWNMMQAYGFNLISNIAQIYRDSITETMTVEKISYISSLNFVSIVLAGIYIAKYKFNRFLIWPMVLIFADQITSGSRGSLMSGIFLFLASVVLFGASRRGNGKKMLQIVLAGCAGFLLITYFRADGRKVMLPYASDFLKKISDNSGMLYRILSYIASPLGVLNEYLKAPVYGNWGESTFRVFHIVLEKLGVNANAREIIDIGVYNTPIQSNVGTYIGELIKDFKIPGALIVCCLLGLLFSYSYIRCKKNNSFLHGILVTAYFYVVCLSFFAWYVRLVIVWYVIFLGGALGTLLDKFKIKEIKWK